MDGRSGRRTDIKRENFKRPFSPRGWLGSARNFGKTRFRRFATFNFSTREKFWGWKISKNVRGVSLVLEERRHFQRRWQIPRQKLLPVVRSFSLYEPWRRGKSGTNNFLAWFSAKKNFNLVAFWMVWYYGKNVFVVFVFFFIHEGVRRRPI